jgi:hypothetical protein
MKKLLFVALNNQKNYFYLRQINKIFKQTLKKFRVTIIHYTLVLSEGASTVVELIKIFVFYYLFYKVLPIHL